MYAVVSSGGKQHKVSIGDRLRLEKMAGKPGDEVKLSPVLFLSADGQTLVGAGQLDKVEVLARIIEHLKGDKTLVFKYKAKKNYHRMRGHRQEFTSVEIEDITYPGKPAAKAAKAKAKAEIAKAEPEAKAAETKAEPKAEAKTETTAAGAKAKAAEARAEAKTKVKTVVEAKTAAKPKPKAKPKAKTKTEAKPKAAAKKPKEEKKD